MLVAVKGLMRLPGIHALAGFRVAGLLASYPLKRLQYN